MDDFSDLSNAVAEAAGAPVSRATYTIQTNGTNSAPAPAAQQSPLDKALAAEGTTGPVADIARSIYTQESGAGSNTKTSNANAVGGMQVQPDTFSSVADKGWNIHDPVQNARAGVRYVQQMYSQAGGDPVLTAAGYYGGPGGLEKARQGIPVSDPRNPGAPNTLQYGQQVASRLPQSSPAVYDPNAFNADDIVAALTGSGQANAAQAQQTVAGPSQASQIPGTNAVAPPSDHGVAQPDQPQTWWDKLKGAGEAALATGTGLAAGVVGPAAGLAYGITHDYGTPQGVRNAADVASNVSDSMTYAPRTQSGQQQTQAIGDAINNSGVMGLAPIAEMQMLGHMRNPSAGGVPISDITQDAPARIEPTLKPRIKLGVDGSQTPIDSTGAPVTATGPQSVGAAASSYSQQAAASGASPEMVAAIAKAEENGQLNSTAAARHIEASSLPVPVDLTAGQATGDVNILSHEQNTRGAQPGLAERFNGQNGQLIENINAIRDQAAPDVFGANHVENGQSVINSYLAKDDLANTDISAKYQALKDANGGDFPLKGSDFVNSADAALKADNVTRFLPPEVGGILGDLRDGGAMTVNDFENYRTILAQQARKAARSGDGTAEHAINVVRNSLESIPMSDEAAAIKPLADAARSAAKARFDALREDPAYNAAVNGTVAPDDFIHKFVVSGKVGDVGIMQANLADDPSAAQAIASGAINHLKNRAGVGNDAGNFSQAGYNKALQAMAPKLNALVPSEQAQQLQTLGNVSRYTTEQPRGAYVNNSNTLVGSMANSSKELVLGVLNAKTYGASGLIRNKLAERAASKSAAKSLEVGAGLTNISGFPK